MAAVVQREVKVHSRPTSVPHPATALCTRPLSMVATEVQGVVLRATYAAVTLTQRNKMVAKEVGLYFYHYLSVSGERNVHLALVVWNMEHRECRGWCCD